MVAKGDGEHVAAIGRSVGLGAIGEAFEELVAVASVGELLAVALEFEGSLAGVEYRSVRGANEGEAGAEDCSRLHFDEKVA